MKFGIIGNINKPATARVTGSLIAHLRRKNLQFVIHEELEKLLRQSAAPGKIDRFEAAGDHDLPRSCDVLVALGGDGTMLTAARIVGAHGTPVLGVNVGKLGFLAEVSIDELEECIDDVVRGNYFIDERMTLESTVSGYETRYFALNDIVIDRGSSPRVLDMETYVNDDYVVNYTADGLIIATPTGSTAYSLASGGPIVEPHSTVMVITPISPHTLTARPVIVRADSTVRVTVRSAKSPVHITADGQLGEFFSLPVEFVIRKAAHTIRLIKRANRTYYDLLRTKLMWGRDVRVEKR